MAQKAQASFYLSGWIEVDENYLGGVRKGKRGRGAAGKIPVFWLLKRSGRVNTPEAKVKTLLLIIKKYASPLIYACTQY